MEKFNYLNLVFLLLFLEYQTYGIEIEMHPRDLVVQPVGSNLTLFCKAIARNSTPVTEFEWRDSKTNKDTPLNVKELNGEDASILIFSSLSENLAGKYACSARYTNSKQLIAQTEVNMIAGITWVDAPEIQYSVLDHNFQIRCKVKANPAPTVEWLKNGETIDFSSSDRYSVKNDGLTIKNVKESDVGIYTCKAVVSSTGEIKYKHIKLEVLMIPKINAINTIIEVVEGENVSVMCNGTGNPPPSYTWIKENTPKNVTKSDPFQIEKPIGLLKIDKVGFDDDAYYKCIAKNSAGESETRIEIHVLLKPKIYELLNITSSVNTSTTITCKALGQPAPKVSFKKVSNKTPFQLGIQLNHPGIVLENFPDDFSGETIGILRFDRLSRSDDGLYYCIAENSADTAYKTGHITVQFPPTFERTENDLPVWSWDTHPGNLTCIPESIPNATMKWLHNGAILEDSPQIKQFYHGVTSSLIVNPMNESRFYTTYECVAMNILGSAIKKFDLRKATVPSEIQKVGIETMTATTIKFRIVGPPSYYGLPIRSILVNYRRERDRTWSTSKNHFWSFNSSYVLENLIPEEIYLFRFAAKNDVGISAWEKNLEIKMPKKWVPVAPKFLLENSNTVINISSEILERSKYADHYTLKWTIPYDNGDPIDYYMIQYCVTQKVNVQWIISENECNSKIEQNVFRTDYKMSSLKPETTYKVELRAHNAIGLSLPAEIWVETAPGTKENGVYEKWTKTGEPNVQWRIKTDANSTTKLIWYDNNGKEIQTWLKPNENPKYAIESEDEKYTILKIYNITIFDWGYYKLDAINDLGNKSFELFLNVTDKPSVDMELKDFYQVGKTSTLSCRVAAYPEASIDWLYKPCLDASCNFNRMESDYVVTREFSKTAYLNITANQTGYISCIASNILGVQQVSKLFFVKDGDTMDLL